jgi:hypothetical protein
MIRPLALLGLLLLACSRPAPPAVGPTATDVYGMLVDAGCLQPDPVGGASYVAAEHSLPDAPAWLGCLFDGGAVSTCGVPCK